ncbi:hypothetical protein FM069_11950 [Pseudomonas mangiferae]|uniref:Uncharacterized protein n=1 Tax=Pseudomonas mangiferae TaxID=2593654 RepID=A0A553GYZ2_9PSED|nr:hypothetical protein FM069_11950 [Pseudomonas mangiferae]
MRLSLRGRGPDAWRRGSGPPHGGRGSPGLTVHRSPFTVHRSPFTVHRSPFTVHRSPIPAGRFGRLRHGCLRVTRPARFAPSVARLRHQRHPLPDRAAERQPARSGRPPRWPVAAQGWARRQGRLECQRRGGVRFRRPRPSSGPLPRELQIRRPRLCTKSRRAKVRRGKNGRGSGVHAL